MCQTDSQWTQANTIADGQGVRPTIPRPRPRRKTSLLSLGLAGAAWLAALILACSASLAGAAEYRAFWVDGWGAGFLNQSQVNTLLGVPGTSDGGAIRDANCNMVIVQVRRRYDVCYPSGVGEPYMSGLSPANFNALQAMINAAHDTTAGKKRVEVHCWQVTFATAGGAVYNQHIGTATGSLTNFDNYWPTRDDTGVETEDKAFDPGHPLMLQYIVNASMDMVNNFDIDGIHYDYIRFTADNQGYNPTSIARYNARYGLTGQPAASDTRFQQWRRDQVTAVVRQIYARIQKSKPWVKQSGAFVTWNPSPTTSTRAGFQATSPYYDVYSDWDSWMQEGIVDIAVPMTYYNWASLPTDYTRWTNFEKDRKFNRHMIIGPGTYLNSLPNAISELLMTRDPSPASNYGDGFCGYSYRVPYVSGTWAGFSPSLVSQVTPTWADIPTMPWKTAPTKGHIMGTITMAGTGAWADFATASVTGPTSRSMSVDGTGFYAFIDLPPGSYTVTASKTGYPDATASVNVSVGQVTGNMYQQDFVLGANSPPVITLQPQSRTIKQGADAAFAVVATGTPAPGYQWRFNGTNIAAATASTYTRTNVQPADAGSYSVVVSNSQGTVISSNAPLTVIRVGGASVLWRLAPGSRPYLTVASTPNERGLAYNRRTDRLLVVSRTSPTVYVLDADTGADLWTLNTTGVTGGYSSSYYLLMAGVADDGVFYAGNLTLAGNTTAFKLYRWANDNATTVPTVAYSVDPGAGNSQRWGDTLDVRGAGTGTQVIIGSRNSNLAAVLTTTDGASFVSKLITVSDAPTGAFGLGIAFGVGNTFWGKATGQNLRQVAFNLAAGTGATVREYADPAFPGSVAPIGVSTDLNLLGGVNVGTTGNNFRLYDLTPTATNGAPAFITSTNFATDNDNTASGTGTVDFGSDRVYALGADNGIIAMQILPASPEVIQPTQPQIDQITRTTGGQIQLQVGANPGHYAVEATTNLQHWAEMTNFTTSNTNFQYVDPSASLTQRFYRVVLMP